MCISEEKALSQQRWDIDIIMHLLAAFPPSFINLCSASDVRNLPSGDDALHAGLATLSKAKIAAWQDQGALACCLSSTQLKAVAEMLGPGPSILAVRGK